MIAISSFQLFVVFRNVVLSFGFRKLVMVEDVVSIIREPVGSYDVWGAALAWNGPSLYIGSQDVETAFDVADHGKEALALIESGLPLRAVAAFLKENVGITLNCDVPMAGLTDDIPLEKGFVQGRIDSPPRFRHFLDFVLKPVIIWWMEAGYGIKWGYKGERLLTHVVWADNVWIFASSHGMYQVMVDMLTWKLEAFGLRWKPRSLEYMAISKVPIPDNQTITINSMAHSEDGISEEVLSFFRKPHLDVLWGQD